jgi:hypothetical protein
MSNAAVRQAFRDAWPAYGQGFPYVDAINLHPGTLPPAFGSLGFQVETRRDTTMGSLPWVEESGSVLVSFFTPAGAGDGPAMDAATAAAAWLLGRRFGPDLIVTGLTGPNDGAEEAEGEFFEAQLLVNYAWQGREARAGTQAQP